MAADLGDGAASLGNVLVVCEWYDDHARDMQLMEAGFATGQCNNAVQGLAHAAVCSAPMRWTANGSRRCIWFSQLAHSKGGVA